MVSEMVENSSWETPRIGSRKGLQRVDFPITPVTDQRLFLASAALQAMGQLVFVGQFDEAILAHVL